MQSEERLLPAVSTYFPAEHSAQLLSRALPTVVEYFPPMQSMQAELLKLAVFVEYLPAAQAMHPLCSASEYVPGAHAFAVLFSR
jgi:hypothetical protein